MKLLLPLFLAAAFLSGCCDTDECKRERDAIKNPTSSVTSSAAVNVVLPQPPVNFSKRVTVERIDIVGDQIAYGEVRGVYIIRDNKTGQEFIGVSGIGIAETGSHKAGKATVLDER